MKCPNCGKLVLRNDFVCKNCGYVLKDAVEAHEGNNEYRSRFVLLFRTWCSMGNGSQLKWLGFDERAERYRQNYGMGWFEFIKELMVSGMTFNVVNVFLLMFKLIFWFTPIFCIEFLSIAFGKYREDANGHPVRYFKPTK